MKKESLKVQIQAEEIMSKIKMQSKPSNSTLTQKDPLNLRIIEQEETLNNLKQYIIKYSARINQYQSESALKCANFQSEICQTDIENDNHTLLEEIKVMHLKEKICL